MPGPDLSWLDRLVGRSSPAPTPMDKAGDVSAALFSTTPGMVDTMAKQLAPSAASALFAPEPASGARMAQKMVTRDTARGGMDTPTPEQRQAAEDDFLRRFWELKAEADRIGANYGESPARTEMRKYQESRGKKK